MMGENKYRGYGQSIDLQGGGWNGWYYTGLVGNVSYLEIKREVLVCHDL